jgi:hypothetical protein
VGSSSKRYCFKFSAIPDELHEDARHPRRRQRRDAKAANRRDDPEPEAAKLLPSDVDVLITIMRQRRFRQDVRWCSIARLVELTGLSRRSVQLSIDRLAYWGWVWHEKIDKPDPDDPKNETGWRFNLTWLSDRGCPMKRVPEPCDGRAKRATKGRPQAHPVAPPTSPPGGHPVAPPGAQPDLIPDLPGRHPVAPNLRDSGLDGKDKMSSSFPYAPDAHARTREAGGSTTTDGVVSRGRGGKPGPPPDTPPEGRTTKTTGSEARLAPADARALLFEIRTQGFEPVPTGMPDGPLIKFRKRDTHILAPEPSDLERWRRHEPDLIAALDAQREAMNASPRQAERKRPEPISREVREHVMGLIDQLRGGASEAACHAFADALAELFKATDRDTTASRIQYLRWARAVRSGRLAAGALIDAFSDVTQATNPGAAMVAAIGPMLRQPMRAIS